MKLKISFDKKAIGNFFLEHSEKVLLGAFVLAFAAIIYGAAMRREKFEKIPSELVANCNKAKQSLEGERPELLTDLTKEQQAREDKGDYKKDAEKIAVFSQKGISVKPYECDVAFDKPLFGQRGKRGQPELIDPEEVRMAADFGAFQFIEGAGGGAAAPPPRAGGGRIQPRVVGSAGAIRGKHWVVITGLVPLEKQAIAFRKAFADSIAYDPTNDVPTYEYFLVDRAEIKSPDDEAKPIFTKTFNSNEIVNEATKDWPQRQPDVVEGKYVDPVLTFPLGPLQFRSWGANVAHAPEIPLLTSYGAGEGDAGERADAANRDDNPPPEAAPAPPANRGAPGRGAPRNPMMRTDRGRSYGGESAEYKLLRFFDFSAEPGKSYVYRVRLVLKNPNNGLDASKLKKPEYAQNKTLETPDLSQLDAVDTTSLEKLDKSELKKLNIPQLKNLNLTQLDATDAALLEKLNNGQLDKLDKTQKDVLQKLDKTQTEALQKWLSAVQSLKNTLQSSSISIYVPKDTQVLVGAAKSEDLAAGKFPVVLKTWAQKSGRAGYYSMANVDHGQVLNVMNEKVVPIIESPTHTASDPEDIKADFITDATLLDMEGGKKFTAGKDKKTLVPREMLFMMVNGKSITLILHEELEDMSEITRITAKPETSSVPDRRGPPIRGVTDPRDLIRGGGDTGRGRPATRP
jgi:hypothetical protein